MKIIDKIRNLLEHKFVKAFRLSADDAKNLLLEFDTIKRDLASFEDIAAERLSLASSHFFRAQQLTNDYNLLQYRMNKKVDDFNNLEIENHTLKDRIAGFDMVLSKRAPLCLNRQRYRG